MSQRLQCPFCFEKFPLTLYLEDGEFQELTYDCEICCHPIEVQARWNPDREKFDLTAQRSSGFD